MDWSAAGSVFRFLFRCDLHLHGYMFCSHWFQALKQTYLKIAWKYGCDFLAASDVAKPSKADMEHMNEKGHKNLAKAIESFLVEKERNHSNNYVNVV